MKYWLMISISLAIVTASLAQQAGFDIEGHISQLIQQGDETENQTYYNLLLYYYDNPININKAHEQELGQLNLLSKAQIDEILMHRDVTGDFKSIYELQSLNTLTITDIKNIIPFIMVGKEEPLKNSILGLFKGNSNYATLGYSRLGQLSSGYIKQNYSGSPERMQFRLRMRNPGHLSIGLSAQKDPGETWLTQTPIPSTDYLSAHIFLENQGRIKQLALGDYRLQFGQGLVLGAGFMVGKNVETVASIKQASLGILPYTSITESSFFRGSGLRLKLTKALDITVFYSNQYLDATINDSTSTTVSSIRTSGLHRTIAEINARNQLHEQVWGSAITLNLNKLATGVLVVNTQFDKAIVPSPRDYNKYRFAGNQLLNYSWFGQYRAANFLIFGEIAKTNNAGMGINLGVISSISKYINLSILYRKFEVDFHSLYGLPFAERSTIGNEKGIYWGLQVYPWPKITISAYYDMYHFPWLTSTTAAPSSGMDYMLRAAYIFNDDARAFIQLRNETGETKENNGAVFYNQEVSLLKTVLNFDYNLDQPLTFRSRIQYNRFNSNNIENGWLLYQDINYNNLKFGLTGRILLFDTDSFGARQYVYEKDVLFTYNTKLFNGQGISYYLMLKYKPIRNLSIRVKCSYTEYANQFEIGSGNDLILGNRKTQFTGQVHYLF